MNQINKNAYFESRKSVGKIFAKDLEFLKDEKVEVLAVSPGGLVIAAEIAKHLNSEIGMLQLKHVTVPGDTNLGVINSNGGFTYDEDLTKGEIEEYNIEYRNNIEANKFDALHKLHVMSGIGELEPKSFAEKNVIIVTDMARTGTSIKAALDFLKYVSPKFICIATAVAQLDAIDIMHRYGDKVMCLHATDKKFGSNHYFGDNSIPNNETILQILSRTIPIKK